MHTPLLQNHEELNSCTRDILCSMIENLSPVSIAGINVSVLYPKETRRPLVGMFDHVMKEALEKKFDNSQTLVTLSEFDREINFYESDDFWEVFYEGVCSDKSVDLLNSLGTGATFKELSGKKLSDVEIPIPPLDDQKVIIKKHKELSVKTKKLETKYQQKLNDLEELKKSILQKAFNGELKTSKISA